MKKKIGYAVYRAADGCSEEYYGRVTSLRAARTLAARGNSLPKSEYDTARAAGHCCGLSAPHLDEGEMESEEATAWFGRGGWDCAVPIYRMT